MSKSEAGKGDNVAKRTNYSKFWENYPKSWKPSVGSDDSVKRWKKKDSDED